MATKTNIVLTADDRTRAAFASAEKSMRELENAGARLNSVLGAVGLGISTGVVIQMADDYANLQARLSLASRSAEEYAAANEAVRRIAAASQAPLLETATLYTRIAASLKDTAVSQADMVNTTEAVALSLRISGASAGESASAMLQFSQAIASGVLRGEEFNAVNESAPRLLQALASSLGVGVGKLREMAKEGKLTREVLIAGLAEQLPKLREEAEKMPKTLGAAFTELQNSMLLTIGQLNEVSGSGKTLAATLVEIGKPAITTTFQTLGILGANLAYVFNQTGNEIGGMAAQIAAIVSGDFRQAGIIGDLMRQDAVEARKELDDLEKRIMNLGQKAQAQAQKPGPITAAAVGAAKALTETTLTDEQARKMQDGLAKAFDLKPIDDYLANLQSRAEKIKAEYQKLKLDLTGPDVASATGLDVQTSLGAGRAALASGDSGLANANLERAKNQLAAAKSSGAVGFEAGYLADQMQALDLALNEQAIKTAEASKAIMLKNNEAMAAEVARMDPIAIPVATDAIANDVRRTLDTIKRELVENPLKIPVELVGAGASDLARAATKLGGR